MLNVTSLYETPHYSGKLWGDWTLYITVQIRHGWYIQNDIRLPELLKPNEAIVSPKLLTKLTRSSPLRTWYFPCTRRYHAMYDTIIKEARRHLVVYASKNILSGVKEAVCTKQLCIVNCNTKGYSLTKFEANWYVSFLNSNMPLNDYNRLTSQLWYRFSVWNVHRILTS